MERVLVNDRVGTEGFLQPVVGEPIIPMSPEVLQHIAQLANAQEPETAQLVSELEAEQELREKTAQVIGRVGVAEATTEAPATVTLKEAAQRAEQGDEESRKLVKNNVRTDYIERAYKSGHVIRVVLSVDQHNK